MAGSDLPSAHCDCEVCEVATELAEERIANGRLREALKDIAHRPVVERNPDGDDQAAHTMQLIAREALSR